ncbi:MAG: BtpA/SgcQ family protein [Gammaproteobacteria bacterium]|nr:BtpA/SgcQ family protein [Gammaproteobacteria bacterium]
MPGPLIGMVHLGALVGAPHFANDMHSVVQRAIDDAVTLERAGFDALLVENFGDAPFFADAVPPVTVAAMARALSAVIEATSIAVGVNVLRNDAVSALSIAAACDASFIRVNVLSGTMFTDQGVIEGRAAELSRLRSSLGPDIEILADVFVKHAVPPPGLTLTQAVEDLCERGGADAIVVSGTGTGRPTEIATIDEVRAACGRLPIFVGSGASIETIEQILQHADGVIVGTAIEVDGRTTNPIDPERAAAFVAAARGASR